MGKMLDKKKRVTSAQAVNKFLEQTTGTERYDVLVCWLGEDNKRQADIFRNVSISFINEQYPHDEISYSISIHYGDDVTKHSIAFTDLPPQNKTYFNYMVCGNDELSFHGSWHKLIWFHIFTHVSSYEHEEHLEEIIRDFLDE